MVTSNHQRTIFQQEYWSGNSCIPFFPLLTDRYILLGNHIDAWVFGAVDPSSGTAVLMEVARVMSVMLKQGRSVHTID